MDKKKYIRKFRSNCLKSMKDEKIVVYLIYSERCAICNMQFKHFKNYLGINFDENDSKTKRERLIDRIYILSIDTAEFRNLEEKLNFYVEGTPCWIRYPEMEFLCYGFQAGKGLKEVTKKKGSIY